MPGHLLQIAKSLNSNKAPKSHAAADDSYGLSTADKYGHAKVYNGLGMSSHQSGVALSAYQGYVLNNKIPLVVEGKTITGIDIPASGSVAKTASVAKSGYTPIGVVGYRNTNSSIFYPYQWTISDTTLTMAFRNINTSAITNTGCEVFILYQKN